MVNSPLIRPAISWGKRGMGGSPYFAMNHDKSSAQMTCVAPFWDPDLPVETLLIQIGLGDDNCGDRRKHRFWKGVMSLIF